MKPQISTLTVTQSPQPPPVLMASQNHHHQLHFVLVPLMSPGHFIPMIDMAKLLAQHGATVTIITTPLIAARFTATVHRAAASGLPLRLLPLPFPTAEAGLPEGCETVDTLLSLESVKKFFLALGMWQHPFERLFEQLEPIPSCIIADNNLPWLAETARDFRVPRIVFNGMSCFTQLCSHNLHVSGVHESVSESEPFVLPNLPDTIAMTKSQLPGSFNPRSFVENDFRKRVRAADAEAYGIVINSFEELEQRYVNEFRKVKGERVWCIGPLSLCNKEDLDKAERGNKASIDKTQYCLEWLDEQEPGSVVYACLGSISRLAPSHLVELGLGLESSERPFVWVIRGGESTEELYKWIEEDGFEERVKGRGLIIRGWAPQVLILEHPAVGAFLTHCGWNSTLEGVCVGMPMITWPILAEQFFNEKLVEVVLDVGVSVGAKAVVHIFEEDKYEVVVKREAVREAVEKVMDGGVEGGERRKRVREYGEMAKRAVEEGGSSHLNVVSLIEDITKQVGKVNVVVHNNS